MTEKALQRAYLSAKETGERVQCMFNPTELKVSLSSSWKRGEASRGSTDAPPAEFTGTKPAIISMELLFDGWEDGGTDVTPDVEMLLSWTRPTADSVRNNTPQPPIVVLHWGTKSYFEVYVKTVAAKYQMFDAEGNVLRARVTLTLEQTPMDVDRQNPTSGGVAGRRTHVMAMGDSLHSIAHREYRRSGYWRALAETNGIDDPLRIPPGRPLLIPPRSDAARLS